MDRVTLGERQLKKTSFFTTISFCRGMHWSFVCFFYSLLVMTSCDYTIHAHAIIKYCCFFLGSYLHYGLLAARAEVLKAGNGNGYSNCMLEGFQGMVVSSPVSLIMIHVRFLSVYTSLK